MGLFDFLFGGSKRTPVSDRKLRKSFGEEFSKVDLRKVGFSYDSSKGDGKQYREVDITHVDEDMRFGGYCYLRKAPRTFSFSRISGLITDLGNKKKITVLDLQRWAFEHSEAVGSKRLQRDKRVLSRMADKMVAPHESEEIAAAIASPKQYRALERKLDRAEDALLKDFRSYAAEEKAEERVRVLKAAVELASHKVFTWQFLPEVDIHTTKAHLEMAYKVLNSGEYDKVRGTLGDTGYDWLYMTCDDEKEQPEFSLKPLIKFREIVESDKSQSEKIKQINALVKRSKIFVSEGFFEEGADLSPGDQWFLNILYDANVPLAQALYEDGYTTIESCIALTAEEFGQRKGVGASRLEQFVEFQKRHSI